MLILSTKLKDISVMSLQTGAKIAQIKTAIIDPGTLTVVAYHLVGRRLESDNVLLLTRDVREISNIGLIVDSADELVLEEDMVALKDILKSEFNLIDKPVIDDNKTKLGRIYDYTLDPMDFKIYQLYVKRPLLKSLQTSDLIINRSQIIEVNNKNIVVSSANLEQPARTSTANDFVNPFRKSTAPSANSSISRKP